MQRSSVFGLHVFRPADFHSTRAEAHFIKLINCLNTERWVIMVICDGPSTKPWWIRGKTIDRAFLFSKWVQTSKHSKIRRSAHWHFSLKHKLSCNYNENYFYSTRLHLNYFNLITLHKVTEEWDINHCSPFQNDGKWNIQNTFLKHNYMRCYQTV